MVLRAFNNSNGLTTTIEPGEINGTLSLKYYFQNVAQACFIDSLFEKFGAHNRARKSALDPRI